MMRIIFIFIATLLFASTVQGHKYPKGPMFGALFICENEQPRFIHSNTRLRAFRGNRCTRRVVEGTAAGMSSRKKNHADLWPVNKESFRGLTSIKELQFGCKGGHYVSLVKAYRTKSAPRRRRWRKVFKVSTSHTNENPIPRILTSRRYCNSVTPTRRC